MNDSRYFGSGPPLRLLALSLFIALLWTLVSLAGLTFPAAVYPTEALRRAFLANDVVSLFIGLPILLGSVWLARRGNLLGVLFWPGALFYVTYNSIAYSIGIPPALTFIPNLTLVILSVYATYNLLLSLDGPAVQARLQGKIPERGIGGLLIGFGALFFIMAAAKAVNFITGQAAISWSDVAVSVADLLVTPAWIAGGVLLWVRRAAGYACGAGLLFQASMLFVGLLIFFILQPIVSGVPFPVDDFVVISAMSLLCLIPLGLVVRRAAG